MNIIDALQEPAFTLPKKADHGYFPTFLTQCFDDYLTTIKKIKAGAITEWIAVNLTKIESLCKAIVKSANTYYEGFPSKAYFEFETGLKLIEDDLSRFNVLTKNNRQYRPFYRARTGENKQFERHEMFHMPFQKREKVTTNRFSVPGLPCLYLSNSIYVCWEELRRPDFNKMMVSRYRQDNLSLKFLDLSLSPSYLGTMLSEIIALEDIVGKDQIFRSPPKDLDYWDFLTESMLLRWPLIAACSIKVFDESGTFKPEYIFPQFLLQWVTNDNKFDGIVYFSVEANFLGKIDHSSLLNYAIPVKEVSRSGYCKKLAESFSLTEPVSWELLTLTNPEVIKFDKERLENNILKLMDGIGSQFLELIKGVTTPYYRTVFGKLEIEMCDLTFDKITD